ncbi:oligosaccharide flippase family protein [Thalassoroseus pseudoceratinae]|uniref:oligosaccharide flippase family protein n=1 Tax=Thalassoroseus pseudoceratinae TaxID=2713176 RepID=UPI00142343A4|nr:oligosaccharide flippase family protein [Thalassoroseus pseudoceratinae]
MRWHRDLLKHSSIYSLGEILTRLTSLLLLPIYTRYLAPSDYGVMAIIDLLIGLLAIVLGGGLAAAVSRFHFDYEDEASQRAVWWTGLTFVAVVGGLGFVPSWLMREHLADWTLGESVNQGGWFYTLALGTMWLACIEQIPMVYLRVRKWSGRFVLLSLFRLGLNIALNLSLLARGWGVAGVLWGNFLTGIVLATVSVGMLAWELKRFRFDIPLLQKMLRFGSPLIIIAFLSLLMHQADRWILHRFASMSEVGVYSLAYRIGQGMNQVLLLPFASIWGVMIYDVAKQPDARSVYARVFGYYTKIASLFLLAGALASRMLIKIVATDDYAAAGDVIPVILLAYLAFSWHDHFRIPVLLKKRTLSMVPVSLTATVVNVAANFALVPFFGGMGAAWATVITFATFTGLGLFTYQRGERYPYRFGESFAVVVGMAVTYGICRWTTNGVDWQSVAIGGGVWLAWAVVLFAKPAWNFWKHSDRSNSTPTLGSTVSAASQF